MERHAVWASLIGLATGTLLIPTDAHADPVDNPGFFVWDTGGVIVFNDGNGRQALMDTGSWGMDIDSAGDIDFSWMLFAPNTITTDIHPNLQNLLVQVLVTPGASSGILDASTGDVRMELELRLKFTEPSGAVGSTCITPAFTAEIEGTYTYDPGGPDELEAFNQPFQVAPLVDNCNGWKTIINDELELGVTDTVFDPVSAVTDDGPNGS
jgi:hypothetical protein